MNVKTYLRRLLRVRGYDVTTFPQGSERLDAHLTQLFRLLQIDHVLDVGANTGQYGTLLREVVGFDGVIDAFEPVAESAALLRARASNDPSWHGYELALGDADGEQPLHVTRNRLFSSFLTPNARIEKRFGSAGSVHRTAPVSVRRLDTLIPELVDLQKGPRLFLKLDTQGYDLQVLAGATGIWDRILAVQIELSVRPLYAEMVDYLSALDRLQSQGLELTGLFPVTRDPGLRVIEFDAVLIHRAAINANGWKGDR